MRASSASSASVRITAPSCTGVTHAGWSFGAPSTSTRHMRHMAGADSAGW